MRDKEALMKEAIRDPQQICNVIQLEVLIDIRDALMQIIGELKLH